MKHLSEQDRILLRQLCKKVQKEIHDAWDKENLFGKNTSEAAGRRDKLARAIFLAYEPLLKPKFKFTEMLIMVGYLEGTIKEQ